MSQQETARPLLTPGEVMQLPTTDEIVLVSGSPPVRACKARYYEDHQLRARVLSPPDPSTASPTPRRTDDWSAFAPIAVAAAQAAAEGPDPEETRDGGIRREPALAAHEWIAPEPRSPPEKELPLLDDEPDDDVARARTLRARVGSIARQATLDPDDGIAL